MRKTLFLLFLIVIAGFSLPQQDSIISESRKPNLGIYLVEGGSSFFVGNVVGIGVPILLAATFSVGDDPGAGYSPSVMYLLAYPVIYPLASALAIDVTGKIFKYRGSFWGAVGGGFFGIGLGIGSCILLRDENTQLYGWSLMAVLPPLCATTGYNVFRKKTLSHSGSFFDENVNVNLTGQFYHDEKKSFANPKIAIKMFEIKF
ncbi:MAG: hypothetical protein ABIL66_10810 [candidate division WOR-3 bacterium]